MFHIKAFTISTLLLAIVAGRQIPNRHRQSHNGLLSVNSVDDENGHQKEGQKIVKKTMISLKKWMNNIPSDDDDDDDGEFQLLYIMCKIDSNYWKCKPMTAPMTNPEKRWKNKTDSHEWSVGGKLLCQLCSLEESRPAMEKCEARFCF